VGSTIVFKYTRLVCKTLGDKDKLYSRDIKIAGGARLQQIIKGFFKTPNILKFMAL
jgi:hypothetical protein